VRSRSSVVPDSLLSISEVAERLGVSGRTVRRLIQQKQINYVLVGMQYRIRPAALELFLSQREVKAAR